MHYNTYNEISERRNRNDNLLGRLQHLKLYEIKNYQYVIQTGGIRKIDEIWYLK